MELAKCKCGYKLEKSTWESLTNTIYRNVGSNICPKCKEKTLKLKIEKGRWG